MPNREYSLKASNDVKIWSKNRLAIPERLRQWFWRILGAILLVPIIWFLWLLLVLNGPWSNHLSVSGRVLDAKTGKPVSHAKVVVSAWHHDWVDPLRASYGVITDKKGHFSVQKDLKFAATSIELEACTPENKYANKDIFLWVCKPLINYAHYSQSNSRWQLMSCQGMYDLQVDVPEDLPYSTGKNIDYPSFEGVWSTEYNRSVFE